jgi:hypothetical protein
VALKIRANSFFVNRYLKVTDTGVIFVETAAMGGKRKFNFGQIDYLLMSPSNVLSFQVGHEVFSIPIRPKKARHQQAVQQLKTMVAASQQQTGGFPVLPMPQKLS